jgi:hypothetical protein
MGLYSILNSSWRLPSPGGVGDNSLVSVFDYIFFCVDIVTSWKQIRVFPNVKPWMTPKVKSRNSAFRTGDTNAYSAVRSDLKKGMRGYQGENVGELALEVAWEWGRARVKWECFIFKVNEEIGRMEFGEEGVAPIVHWPAIPPWILPVPEIDLSVLSYERTVTFGGIVKERL